MFISILVINEEEETHFRQELNKYLTIFITHIKNSILNVIAFFKDFDLALN